MSTFSPETLVSAITQLFELNHYSVSGPTKVHGAEVDLVAIPIADPFGRRVYIEATVEYVDNDKYGKDVGKLAMIGELDRDAQRLIVSSKGFSLPVRERAGQTRIETLTYDELFKKFERFEPYLSLFDSGTEIGRELASLASIYEEPEFEDDIGTEFASAALTAWRDSDEPDKRWIVITGEYGTGKTALTKTLHYRWLKEYRQNPKLPIPFRIELRSFVRQFDARGLLHHFLDKNHLSHISVEFVENLIRTGRAVLILDGYDEMAQYFNARERRQCLEALATLSAEGAKGLITSRPNYFTQSEELQVFEVLYSSLKAGHFLSASAQQYLERESQVDELLQRFLDRFERVLRDLTPQQTAALVARILGDDPRGLLIVQQILGKIFRHKEGASVSLSGKPVIVSYLLEVVEQLKKNGYAESELNTLSEWQIYKLIVDQLMLRDMQRSPEIAPDARRKFLQRLALYLSKKEHEVIGEDALKDLVASEFKREIGRLTGEAKLEALSRYFSDLRSSATLTRALGAASEGWRFSHNSLREFLIAEQMVGTLLQGALSPDHVPISDAMRSFAGSIDGPTQLRLLSALQASWAAHASDGTSKGQYLCLLWDGFLGLSAVRDVRALLLKFSSVGTGLAQLHLVGISASDQNRPSNLAGLSFSAATFSNVAFQHANLTGADFSGSTLDNVDFRAANLEGAAFKGAFLFEVNLIDSSVAGANFEDIGVDSISILVSSEDGARSRRLEGFYALGYLRYNRATTAEVPLYYVYSHHPKFPIVYKIVDNLSKQAQRQRRGLEQRGAAHIDVPFARQFVDYLVAKALVEVPKARKDMLQPTERGRSVFQAFVDSQRLEEELLTFLRDN
jgi:uncharacterized protein YjbI with pentapeptide repeats